MPPKPPNLDSLPVAKSYQPAAHTSHQDVFAPKFKILNKEPILLLSENVNPYTDGG